MKTYYSNSANYKKGDRAIYENEVWEYKPKKDSDVSTGKVPSTKNGWKKEQDKKVDL